MMKLSNMWAVIRRWLKHEKAYSQAYRGGDWRSVLFFRKQLFKQTADEVGSYLARGRILDVGTGPGRLPLRLVDVAPNITCVGIDIERIVLLDAWRDAYRNRNYDRVSFLLADVQTLPFTDQSFDMVVSMMSIHQWHDRDQGLIELHRVLKNDGVILILVGRMQIYPGKVELLDFFKNSSAKYMSEAFKNAGFKNIHTTYPKSNMLRITGQK